MCRLKEGSDIKTYADLQNLISGIILRQTTEFSLEEICRQVESKANGFHLNDSGEIHKRCTETLSALYSIDCIKCMGDDKYKLAIGFPSIY